RTDCGDHFGGLPRDSTGAETGVLICSDLSRWSQPRFSSKTSARFTLDEDVYEIAEVEDRWYEPEAMYFRVRTTEGKRYILPLRERRVAIKFIHPSSGDDVAARERLRREALASALDHPFICKIHEIGEADGHVHRDGVHRGGDITGCCSIVFPR